MRQFTLFLSDTIFIALIYMQSTNNFMLANDAILVYDDQIYVEGDNENSDSSHELTEMIREERPKWQPKPSIRDDKKEVKSCLWKEVVDLRIPGCLLPGRSIYSSFNRSFLGKGGRSCCKRLWDRSTGHGPFLQLPLYAIHLRGEIVFLPMIFPNPPRKSCLIRSYSGQQNEIS